MSGIRAGGLIIGSGGGGGGGGVSDHRLLTNRDANNQHPISAIDGLEAALDDLLDEAKEYADDEIADKVVAGQSWLPAVSIIADLPSAYGTPEQFVSGKTWLCRVRANNNVYQCIAGQDSPVWALYSENTDFVDETELAAAINKTTVAAPISEEHDKFAGATAWTFANWFAAVVAKINGLITGLAGTVKIEGNQTVDGTKSFSSSPLVPTPTNDAHAASKAYVDGVASGGGGSGGTSDHSALSNRDEDDQHPISAITDLADSLAAKVSISGEETISGLKIFDTCPIVPTAVDGGQAANKDYVDNHGDGSVPVKTITAFTYAALTAITPPLQAFKTYLIKTDTAEYLTYMFPSVTPTFLCFGVNLMDETMPASPCLTTLKITSEGIWRYRATMTEVH